jgi:hypothetical protein
MLAEHQDVLSRELVSYGAASNKVSHSSQARCTRKALVASAVGLQHLGCSYGQQAFEEDG